MALSTASNVAKWFIVRNRLEEINDGDPITNLKLQKLLYYAQGSTLAMKDTRLFDEPIEAWKHGPVVPTVYEEYKYFGSNGIELENGFDMSCIDQETTEILEEVYDVFGQYTAWRLRNMTHEETPWLSVWNPNRPKQAIDTEIIKKYFKEHYIEQ